MNAGKAQPIRLAAAVLAGGRSSRMGGDKAFLSWNGLRLIDRQVQVLGALGPDELLISGRSGVDYGLPRISVVLDRNPDEGPLSGLCAVLEATHTSHVLLLAVDMPAMKTELLKELIRRCRPGAGVVPVLSSGFEPLAAVYPRRCYGRALAHLRNGRRAMRGFAQEAMAAGELDPYEIAGECELAFANWNRPEDIM